jgi:hypothetical protein
MDYRIRFSHPHWLGLLHICAKHVPAQFVGVMEKYNDIEELVSNFVNT